MDKDRETNEEMLNSNECWQQIKDLIVKTVIACHPSIAHMYKSTKPQDIEQSLCFQVLGFDIFIDKKGRPWLIEVN
jgi:hypothetical protein